jgi:hypothetical protein
MRWLALAASFAIFGGGSASGNGGNTIFILLHCFVFRLFYSLLPSLKVVAPRIRVEP